jgi:ABC-type phosphate transport system substrate-binding protein
VYPFGAGLLNFPCAVAGVSPIYNLPNSPKLQLEARALARIFSGKYGNWGQVAANFPNAGISNLDSTVQITIVVRGNTQCPPNADCADLALGSGSTGFFTKYLSTSTKLDPNTLWTLDGNGTFSEQAWREAYGTPAGLLGTYDFAATSQDVIDKVNATQGAIGYVGFNNFLIAGSNASNTHVAAVQSNVPNQKKPKAPNFIVPSAFSIGLAITNFGPVPQNLLINTINRSNNPNAYPIASPTNIVVLRCQGSQCQVDELKNFLFFVATTGQASVEGLGFGRLSKAIINQYMNNLSLLSTCI